MGGFKELVEDFQLIETPHTIEGTRAFYKATDGTADLPSINDSFSDDFPRAFATRAVHTKFFPDPDNRSVYIEKIVVSYSSNPTGQKTVYPDREVRRFQMGGEIITVEDPENWTWNSDSAKVKQPMFISNIMGSFTRQVDFGSDAEKEAWIAGPMTDAGGTINNSEFEGFRKGSVLFSGVSGGNQVDEAASTSWVFELQFNWRIIRDETDAITEDDWLFLWRKDFSGSGQGRWDKPEDENGKFLYAESNFELLFN